MRKPCVHLLTAAVVAKTVLLGSTPVGAVANVAVEQSDTAKEIVAGSVDAIKKRFAEHWQPQGTEPQKQDANKGMKAP